jgi:hypothetical protein
MENGVKIPVVDNINGGVEKKESLDTQVSDSLPPQSGEKDFEAIFKEAEREMGVAEERVSVETDVGGFPEPEQTGFRKILRYFGCGVSMFFSGIFSGILIFAGSFFFLNFLGGKFIFLGEFIYSGNGKFFLGICAGLGIAAAGFSLWIIRSFYKLELVSFLVITPVLLFFSCIALFFLAIPHGKLEIPDSRMVADLKKIQSGLELYAESNKGLYPPVYSCDGAGRLGEYLSSGKEFYISSVPEAPFGREYRVSVSEDGKNYVLQTGLLDKKFFALSGDIDGEVMDCDCDDPYYCISNIK